MSFTKSSENITPTRKEVYQALLRSLKRRKGFGIVFVQCSTAETASIIQRIQQDLPQKKFGVLSLPPPINKRDIFSNKTPPVDNLYDIVANFPERKNLNILLIQGLEKSLQPYIKPGYGGDGDYYNLDTVPPILSHLNQRRDKFRDNFNNICFVFILPFFAIKYFIRRAPDFFDWSAGVFAIESEQLEQKSNQTYNIGNIFLSLGEIEQAIAFYQQSLAISQEIQDRPGEEISLGGLGNAYNSLGQYEKAIDFYEQSLAISREIRNREGEAAYLIGLGNAFYSLAEFERAITFYEQSLVISQEIQDHQGVENSLKSLGNAYYSLGLDEKAIDFYEQSLAISQEIKDRQREVVSLGFLGNAYLSQGQFERAINFYQQSLAISREIKDPQRDATSLIGLGNAYSSLGQFERAIAVYEQSLAICREIGNHVEEATVLGNLGNAYSSLGQFERAIAVYEQSLVISREIGNCQGEAASLIGLGNAYGSLGQFERAIAVYEQSLVISREIGNRQGEAASLIDLANAYGLLGQFKRAITVYEQSLVISREIGNRKGEAASLIGLGNAYSSLGQFERAIAVYEHSLAISRGIGDHQGKVNSLENLSNAYQSLGEYERAIWQLLRSKAQSHPSWLQFLTESEMASVQRRTRKLMLPISSEKIKLKIPVNQSLWMVIDLPFQNYQLLLLNRSQQGQALLCPSSAYAPNSIVDKSPILLPQKYAWASDSEEKFVFGEVGNEEFLAIVLQKPLSLPWLTPSEDEALPEWNAERMKELFKQLEQQGNWQVFYQSFEVVEKQ